MSPTLESNLLDSLSPADQRRAIARDAISQLKTSTLIANSGVFMRLVVDLSQGSLAEQEAKGATLRTLLQQTQARRGQCQVCALGAIIASQLTINGDCSLEDINVLQELGSEDERVSFYPSTPFHSLNGDTFSPYILKYFSAEQLTLIEIAFECGRGSFTCQNEVQAWSEYGDEEPYEEWAKDEHITLSVEEAAAAISFGFRYELLHERLIAIMESIISHPEALFDPTHGTYD